MKINWFCPLPPTPSGIAIYASQVLPALAELADVVVWTEQEEWDPGVERYVEVRRFPPAPWPEVNLADLTVYHLGNHHLWHGNIWRLSQEHPGVVVLHDTSLHHMFYNLYREVLQDQDGYLEGMEHFYGFTGRLAGEALWAGEAHIDAMAEAYPLTPLALNNCLGVLVHSMQGFAQVKALNQWPVAVAELPFALEERYTRPVASAPPYLLVVFGFLGTNRCLGELLTALANLEESERLQFQLNIYGEVADIGGLSEKIRSLGLGEQVRVHGFVPEEELDRALAASHLAINLRHPTMGEASLSQLRIWSHRLPSLVCREGWYADLPDSAVVHVRPQEIVSDVGTHLRQFLGSPERYARLGKEGARILAERHGPRAYAQRFLQLAEAARCYRPTAGIHRFVDRVRSELGSWPPSLLHRSTLQRLARQIHELRVSDRTKGGTFS